MLLESLRVRDCRNLLDVDLELSASINAFEGHNGAGKTSILEAVDVLVRGRSFRTSTATNLINTEKEDLAIDSTVLDEKGLKRRFSIKKGPNFTQRWLDGEKVARQSELSQYLPVVLVHPNVSELVAGSPSERRTYLDWGLFHVKHGFPNCYKRYNRLLLQRNAALKQRQRPMIKATNVPLSEVGEQYDQFRQEYLNELVPACNKLFKDYGFFENTSFEYHTGWNSEFCLSECLEQEAKGAVLPKFCSVGPHRADLAVKVAGDLRASEYSRGQQKLLALCLKLAQAWHLQTKYNKEPVLLIDELPAELDKAYLEKVLDIINRLDMQVLITCVSREQILGHWKSKVRWFHVERGTVTQTT